MPGLDTGFRSRALDNLLFVIEDATVEEAVLILENLCFDGSLYDKAGGMDLREYAAGYRGAQLAKYVTGVTFQGGPDGMEWYEGNLETVLKDYVLQCCRMLGVDTVFNELNLA